MGSTNGPINSQIYTINVVQYVSAKFNTVHESLADLVVFDVTYFILARKGHTDLHVPLTPKSQSGKE